MSITREELKGLPPYERVQVLTLRKHILQRQMWNKSGRSSRLERAEMEAEIKKIDEMIKLYV